jgi:hypothetical protein
MIGDVWGNVRFINMGLSRHGDHKNRVSGP